MNVVKLVVNVTVEDIKAGVRGNCGTCPVALAFMRSLREAVPSLGDTVRVLVESWQICLWENHRVNRGKHATSTGRDIVRVGNQIQRIMQDTHDAFTKAHGNLGYASFQPTVGSQAALSRGMHDGRTINIAKPLSGPSKPATRSITRKP